MPSTDGSLMAEQLLDLPAESRRAGRETGNGLAASVPALIPGWRCLPNGVIRAYGDEGPVDLAALHPAHGVALIAFLDEGQEASPEEARDALRTMLHEEGLERRFPGELPIVALPVPCAARPQLASIVENAFSGMPAPTLPAGWVEWLAERLSERPDAAPAVPRLLAPSRDEQMPEGVVSALLLTSVAEPVTTAAAPPLLAPQRDNAGLEKPAGGIALAAVAQVETASEKAPPESAMAEPSDTPRPETAARHNWLDWGATLGFALGMVAALIAGLTAMLRNGRLF